MVEDRKQRFSLLDVQVCTTSSAPALPRLTSPLGKRWDDQDSFDLGVLVLLNFGCLGIKDFVAPRCKRGFRVQDFEVAESLRTAVFDDV